VLPCHTWWHKKQLLIFIFGTCDAEQRFSVNGVHRSLKGFSSSLKK
jgi:hypothetical protein